MNPQTLTFDRAKELLNLQLTCDKQTQKFYDGDHWQNAEAWMGPAPEKSSADYLPVIAEVKRAFVNRNMIAESVDRHCSATVGVNPHWKYAGVNGADPGDLAGVVEELQSSWLDTHMQPFEDNDDATPLVELVRYLLLQRRGVMRLLTRGIYRNEQGVIEQASLADSLNKLEFHTVDPAQGAVLIDGATRQRYGVYAYSEIQEDDTTIEKVEICYVDRLSGETVIRLLQSGNDGVETRLNLGGRLTMHEVRRPALIREDTLALQKALNVALTMRAHNVNMAGFLATILTNAQIPGHYEGEGLNRTFVPDPLFLGAGTVNNIVGIKVKDANGAESFATPGVHDRQPVDVTVFDKTEASYERHFLQRVKQLHTLISGDASASGESRKQALADFVTDLLTTANQVSSAMRWLLETSLAWASDFAGEAGKYEGLRANVKCRLKPGPIDNETLRVFKDLRDANFASHELLLSESGLTDDVDSEIQRLEDERKKEAERTQEETRMQLETQVDRVNQVIQSRQAHTTLNGS